MGEWSKVRFGDVTTNFDSKRVPVTAADRQAGPFPYYGASGIVDHVSDFLFDGDYLLVAEDGENLRTRKIPIAFMASGRFWVNNHAHIVQGNDRASTRFLCYLLSQTDVAGYISGSTQPKLTQAALNSIPLNLPDRATQDRVVDVLGALDDKIAVNGRIAETYKRILSLHYANLGITAEPGSGAIPMTELVEFNPKTPMPQGKEIVYVDMAALPTDTARIQTWIHREPKSGARFQNGDTLLARITPCLENGKTGYVDFMADGEIGIGSTEFIVMRSHPPMPSHLSYFVACSARFREHAIRNMAGSSGRQRVSASDAANFMINPPDVDALAKFEAVAGASFASIKSLDAESRTLAALRDTLLPKLMSGELRVRDAERVVEDAT